jgi:uncharacterized protein with ACT and thioredoxin-like domain
VIHPEVAVLVVGPAVLVGERTSKDRVPSITDRDLLSAVVAVPRVKRERGVRVFKGP